MDRISFPFSERSRTNLDRGIDAVSLKASTALNVQLPWHEVEAAINAPVPELKKLIEEILVEKIKFTQCEILGHFLLKVEDVVLDVEADHLTNRQVRNLVHGEHGESLKDKLVLIVVDDRRVFDQEICRRRNGHPEKIIGCENQISILQKSATCNDRAWTSCCYACQGQAEGSLQHRCRA